jgi:hypothetical protein
MDFKPYFAEVDDVYVRSDLYKGKYKPDLEAYKKYVLYNMNIKWYAAMAYYSMIILFLFFIDLNER